MAAQVTEPAASGSLPQRALSAGVLMPIALGAAYLGGWPFAVLVGAVAVLMAREWARLCGLNGFGAVAVVHVLAVVAAVILSALAEITAALALVAAGVMVVAALSASSREHAAWPMIGIVYVALPAIACIYLRGDSDFGRAIIVWLFIVIWATDAGAYFVGRALGGPRLAPSISPGKTWAGLIGGIAAAAIAGAVAVMVMGLMPVLFLTLASAGIAVLAQLGDLIESWVKRRFNAKSSGRLIPGHGGMLDRVDGFVLAAPAVAGLSLLNNGGVLTWR